jgi:hypothetical protein
MVDDGSDVVKDQPEGACLGSLRRRTPARRCVTAPGVYVRGMRRWMWLAVGVPVLYAGLVVGFVPFAKADEYCGSAFFGNPDTDPLFNCGDTRSTLQHYSVALLVIGLTAIAIGRPIRALQARVEGRKRQIRVAGCLLLVGLAVLAVLLVIVWFIFVSQVMSYE